MHHVLQPAQHNSSQSIHSAAAKSSPNPDAGEERWEGGGVPDDVLVLHLLEEGDLADSGGGDAIVLMLEADLLERDGLIGGPVPDLLDVYARFYSCRLCWASKRRGL